MCFIQFCDCWAWYLVKDSVFQDSAKKCEVCLFVVVFESDLRTMYRLQPVLTAAALLLVVLWTGSTGLFIPNLSGSCYRCLCHVATKCDTTHECTGGYCGPFNISRVYWVDAGKVVMPEDDADRNNAWQDCARSYHCSQRIIAGYLERFGKDCSGDGVTDCFDYMMINGNGGYGCTQPLNRSVNGRRWLARFEECRASL